MSRMLPEKLQETTNPNSQPAISSRSRITRLIRRLSQALNGIWKTISQASLAELAFRLGTHALLVALILFIAWGLREFYLFAWLSAQGQEDTLSRSNALGSLKALNLDLMSPEGSKNAASVAALPSEPSVDLPAFDQYIADETSMNYGGILRLAQLHTDIPSLPREEVITYTVKPGDTLFGIAGQYNLLPETILWANQPVLADNPHNLQPGQVLNILPVNGAYHRWSAGDGLNGVAKFFGVTPEAIVEFPGNHLDSIQTGDWANPNIEAGTWLVIPGGRREFVSWSAPYIPRDNPALAKVLGPGACETVVGGGAIGSANFMWPADNHYLSGYDYEPGANHPGVDIAGDEGNPVYATDSGVVVYAGWNNWGYGNVVVINHGNGWQSLYAHLSSFSVSCSQSVYQGNVIGAIGSTGKADGAHLHFEMMYNGVRVNPHEYIT